MQQQVSTLTKQYPTIRNTTLNDPHQKANALLSQCLAHWDAAMKARAVGKDPDEALSILTSVARNVPADASDAHDLLFTVLQAGDNLDTSFSRSAPQVTQNPKQVVSGHWDSSDAIPELWGDLNHGGVLTLEGDNGPERFLITGGRRHFDELLRHQSKHSGSKRTRWNRWHDVLGLTIRRLEKDGTYARILTTNTGHAKLDERCFGEIGADYFDALPVEQCSEGVVGYYRRRARNRADMTHIVRTKAAHDRLIWSRTVSRTTFQRPHEAQLSFDWDGNEMLADLVAPHDPFNPYFAPAFKDDGFLHRSAYLRIISPDPRSRPAIVTYLIGRRETYTGYKERWKMQKAEEKWTSAFTVL